LILAFARILIIVCYNFKKEVEENPYEGACKITYSKYVYPDTTLIVVTTTSQPEKANDNLRVRIPKINTCIPETDCFQKILISIDFFPSQSIKLT